MDTPLLIVSELLIAPDIEDELDSGTQLIRSKSSVKGAKLLFNFTGLRFFRDDYRLCCLYEPAPIACTRIITQIPRQGPVFRRHYNHSQIASLFIMICECLDLIDQRQEFPPGVGIYVGNAVVVVAKEAQINGLISRQDQRCSECNQR